MRVLIASTLFLFGAMPAFAQTPAPTAPPAPAPAASAPATPDSDESQPVATPGAANTAKRAACRAEAQKQGLKGPDMMDQVQLCMAEGRVECLKQAIAQKVRGPARAEFMKGCAS